jgi:hypothetical protein
MAVGGVAAAARARAASAPTSGACSPEGSCAAGFACVDDLCVAIAARGESCLSNPCDDGLFCDGAVCAPVKEAGSSCDLDDECASFTCVDGVCGAVPVSCTTQKGFFQVFVLLSLVVPAFGRGLRRRR